MILGCNCDKINAIHDEEHETTVIETSTDGDDDAAADDDSITVCLKQIQSTRRRSGRSFEVKREKEKKRKEEEKKADFDFFFVSALCELQPFLSLCSLFFFSLAKVFPLDDSALSSVFCYQISSGNITSLYLIVKRSTAYRPAPNAGPHSHGRVEKVSCSCAWTAWGTPGIIWSCSLITYIDIHSTLTT